MQTQNRKNQSHLRRSGVVLGALALAFARAGHAQIATDGTMGAASALGGPNFQIPASLGKTFGPNLFHSFSDFNIQQGQSATFSGPASIQNILSRVTGGRTSVIDGQLNSTIAGANFFFLNPAGIVFGANAEINVSGDFAASTADALKLGNGGVFHAQNPSNTVLTSAPPEAFGFLAARPNPILVQGSILFAAPDKSLSLVGGDITLQNALIGAQNGSINLASVGSAGDATVSGATLDVANFSRLGDIAVRDAVAVVLEGNIRMRAQNIFLDGPAAALSHQSSDGAAGGAIDIRVRGDALLRDGGRIQSLAEGNGKGGDIHLEARAIRIQSHSEPGGIFVQNTNVGAGGDVVLKAKTVEIAGDALLSSDTVGAGKGGDVSIFADVFRIDGSAALTAQSTGIYTDSLSEGKGGNLLIRAREVQAVDTVISASSFGKGDGGGITIEADNVRIESGARVLASVLGVGKGGDLSITATDSIVVARQNSPRPTGIAAETNGPGAGGNITLVAPKIDLVSGALVSAAASQEGNGGKIKIQADTLKLDGQGSRDSTGITAESSGSGSGGGIDIQARKVLIGHGSLISVATFGSGTGGNVHIGADEISLNGSDSPLPTGIAAETRSSGKGGSITLQSRNLNVVSGAQISASAINSGAGGDITIAATETLNVDGRDASSLTAIRAEGFGTGRSGDIHIDAGKLAVAEGARVSTSAYGPGSGGDITVRAHDIFLDNRTSPYLTGIAAETRGADGGRAGNITVTSDNLTLVKTAAISSSSFGGGKGGEIAIKSGNIALDGSGIYSLAGSSGDAGSISIEASGTVDARNASTISVLAGESNGGDITINAGDAILLDKSEISAVARRNGGSVNLSAGRLIYGRDSFLRAQAFGSDGNGGQGGNITENARFIVFNHTESNASAIEKKGGNIGINALVYLPSIDSPNNVTSKFDVAGNVTIQSPYSNVGGLLVALPSDPLGAESYLAERCVVRSTGGSSSFTIDTRRRVPSQPGDLLLSSVGTK